MSRFVEVSRDQGFLLPPDMREWLPADDLAHFVLEAVERVPLDRFQVNERGTGSAQYPPRMMLALLIYCYANGILTSRRIEHATHRDIGVRYVTGNTHPDHDTISAFRRNNLAAVSEAFLEVLLLARELKLLRVGKVSVDGTKIKANASKRRSIRRDRAEELREQLRLEIEGLMERAERGDRSGDDDGQRLPEELSRLETLKGQMDDACERLRRQAEAREARDRAAHERDMPPEPGEPPGGGRRRGSAPSAGRKAPSAAKAKAEAAMQTNLTDPDSALMRKNKASAFEQAYNAQAVVDAEGSQLVLGVRVGENASDRNELVADVEAVDARVGTPSHVLADNGYASGEQVEELQGRKMKVLVATGSGDRRRRHDFRPQGRPKAAPEPKAPWLKAMAREMAKKESREVYRLRQQTVEPVFGVIKQAMGFRQFSLRGRGKVAGEWQLMALAYNCKRLHNMMLA